MEIVKWINEGIQYKETLNEQYRELGNDGRVLYGCGYIQAMKDVLDYLKETPDDDVSPN